MCQVSYRNCWIPRIPNVFNVFLKKSSTSLTSASIGVVMLTSFKSFSSSNRTTSMISLVMPFFPKSTAKQLELSSMRLNASFLKGDEFLDSEHEELWRMECEVGDANLIVDA